MFARVKKLHRGRERTPSLVERHFVMQDERPAGIGEVGVEALDAFLRNLLFTDGTVTRTLAAQMLTSISVEQIDQQPIAVPADVAEYLETPVAEESIRRRVGIGIGSPPAPVLWAESFLIPERLPPGFLGLLETAPDGIGQSLQRVSLESSRELLLVRAGRRARVGLGAAVRGRWSRPQAVPDRQQRHAGDLDLRVLRRRATLRRLPPRGCARPRGPPPTIEGAAR